MKNYAIVLAAGKGTRMRSSYPKVLHRVLGKPMITRVLSAIDGAKIERKYVVVGHGAELVKVPLAMHQKLYCKNNSLEPVMQC